MMIKNRDVGFLFMALSLWIALRVQPAAQALDVKDTRMLSEPAVSGTHIAFIYAEDLWICGLDGKEVRRLTSHEGIESHPRFSPDGTLIAFSGQYDGNTDVYTIPVEGGSPTRLTWHPDDDRVQDFSCDGSAVLFSSPREVFARNLQQLYEVSIEGGYPARLDIPSASKAAYAKDGSRIAYVPLIEAFNQWKNYRGGTASRIWIYDCADQSIEEIPQPESRCNDTDPMWINDKIYFRSDRNGEFNLFSYDLNDKHLEALTQYDHFPVLNASAGPEHIVYEQAGYLHLYDLTSDRDEKLTIGVAADLVETRPRYVSGSKYIRGGAISPSGSRAVFGYRGEIITVPAKEGDPRNLTHTPDVHEHTPAWSPDGKYIAYFSDASGEYALHIAPQDGKGEARTIPLHGAGFYDRLKWSPDSLKLGYSDNSWTLYWVDIQSGESRAISTEPIYGPNKTQSFDWSPDSNWMAYTRTTPTYFQQVYLYSIEEEKSYPVTDGLSDAGQPVFDCSGKYLYMAASTDAGPVRQWFAMSNADMAMTNTLYLAVLQSHEPSPLKRKSDEEKAEEEEKPVEKGADDPGVTEEKEEKETKEVEKVKAVQIDTEGMASRIISLPVGSGLYFDLQAGKEGKLYYLKQDRGATRFFQGNDEAELCCFDLEKREEKKLRSGVNHFIVSANGEMMLLDMGKGSFSIAKAETPATEPGDRLAMDRIRMRIEPRQEWTQIYHEAWRINRDFFYDRNMQGADWPAMREKYQVFLPHLAVRSDLNR
ncbi:MAG: peptidase S41, partial [Planctomycetota bacterium]